MINLAATSIGPVAAEILAPGQGVEVFAAFERSFYLLARDGVVCVGAESIGRGPINVTLRNAGAIDWRGAGLSSEVKGRAEADKLSVGPDLVISLIDASHWQPPPWAPFDPATAARGLAEVRARTAASLPADGLAPLVFAPGSKAARTPTAKAAAQQVEALQSRLPGLLNSSALDDQATRALILLLGLGPGLTPSGDDLIGGLMLALTALRRPGLRDSIWQALAPELNDLTTEISAMHLSAAADGLGAEAIHDLANAILTADAHALPAHLDRVARIGHCSGWDTLAGFALTIDGAVDHAMRP